MYKEKIPKIKMGRPKIKIKNKKWVSRKEALKYYKYTCKKCKKFATQIHHINENKKNNIIQNLMALCTECHLKKHN